MPILPFAMAASLLIWASWTGAESLTLFFYAFIAPLLALIVLLCTWKWIGLPRCHSARARWFNGFAGLVCLGIFISVPLTHWPFRIAYALSRSELDAVALSLKSGVKFTHPMRVGVFSIEKAEIYDHNGKVCLWTVVDPSGSTGFTQCPPNNVPFNLWSSLKLDDEWQYVSED
ncbi:MAG: hypothetical protein EOP06_19650 [Proteobacteria bacterium]|nr:MAG: hypothetical protein EOP06_19650 [Pseudomonadota bacterium]